MSSLGSECELIFFGISDAVELIGIAEYCEESFESLVNADRWKTPVASDGLLGSSWGIGVSGWWEKLGVGRGGAVTGVMRPAAMSLSRNKIYCIVMYFYFIIKNKELYVLK